MSNKIMKPLKSKTRTASKAKPDKKPIDPCSVSLNDDPWKLALIETYDALGNSDSHITDDFYEEFVERLCERVGLTGAQLDEMAAALNELKEEAERFNRVRAMHTLKVAWKKLPAEQQELLRDMSALDFVRSLTSE